MLRGSDEGPGSSHPGSHEHRTKAKSGAIDAPQPGESSEQELVYVHSKEEKLRHLVTKQTFLAGGDPRLYRHLCSWSLGLVGLVRPGKGCGKSDLCEAVAVLGREESAFTDRWPGKLSRI